MGGEYSLYISGTSLCHIHITCHFYIHSSTVCFAKWKFKNACEVPFIDFPLTIFDFCVLFKTALSNPMPLRFSSNFSRSFIVLAPTLRSTIYFRLICVQAMRFRSLYLISNYFGIHLSGNFCRKLISLCLQDNFWILSCPVDIYVYFLAALLYCPDYCDFKKIYRYQVAQLL